MILTTYIETYYKLFTIYMYNYYYFIFLQCLKIDLVCIKYLFSKYVCIRLQLLMLLFYVKLF